jgi:hypothetical protein
MATIDPLLGEIAGMLQPVGRERQLDIIAGLLIGFNIPREPLASVLATMPERDPTKTEPEPPERKLIPVAAFSLSR